MKTDSAAVTNDRKNQVVLLDVGGRVFKTTEYTLLSVPNNYFCQLLQQSAQDQNERAVKQIFIDRDGRLFEYIIGYLRDGSMIELPKDMATLNDLRKEAHFYSMPSLVQLVDARLLDPNRVIQLSVGGIHFSISARTLQHAPQESILHQIASTRGLDRVHEDDSGRFFIDRDGSLFHLFVDYLRNGEIVDRRNELENRAALAKLEQEARFYRMPAFWDEVLNKVYPYRRNFVKMTSSRSLSLIANRQRQGIIKKRVQIADPPHQLESFDTAFSPPSPMRE